MHQLDDALQTFVAESERATVRAAVTSRAFLMLAPCTDARLSLQIAQSKDRLLAMQQAFAKGNSRGVRAMFDTLATVRRAERPADLSMDYTYQEAWLRLAIGDTAGATAELDHALDAISTLSSLRDFASCAALVRAMALRADLAAAKGDHARARAYAASVADLWANADPGLQPMVARMRKLAGRG
jgi:hypothetical protein